MMYQHYGMKLRKPLDYGEVCSRPPHSWRNDVWTAAYRFRRRQELIWLNVFLLLFCLFGFAVVWPFIAAYFAVQP